MILLPSPKEIDLKHGKFLLTPQTKIVLNNNCTFNDLDASLLLKEDIKIHLNLDLSINKAFINNNMTNCICLVKEEIDPKESYKLIINCNSIVILAGDDAGLFYGVQTLRQLLKTEGLELNCMEIYDYPDFQDRGFYHDITRGKVPTLQTLKELVDRASFYKINQLQLYIEHTFAFKNHSELWSYNDPITAEEILILDAYCKKRHIELVPSLSTFGHLYHALSSHSFNHLCELEDSLGKPFSWINRMGHHTLDVSNADSIEFVKDMLEQFIPLFSSDKFNICCDETFDLGTGKSKKQAKELGKGRLYVDFLNQIIETVKQYDKKVMFWGDIIIKYPDLINEIPNDVICLNWNYSAAAEDTNTRIISESGLPQYVCPGVSGWDRLMNDLDGSFSNIKKMVQYGRKYNSIGVLNTDWGDYGHINCLANSIPGMIYGAALSWNCDAIEDFSIVDSKISKLEFEDKSGSIVGLLRELSRQHMITFMEVIWWKEDKFNESSFLKEKPQYKEKYLLNLNEDELHKKYKKTLKLQHEILKLKISAPEFRSIDFEEFYISAQGIALLNSLYLIIKKYELNENVNNLIHAPKELAVKLEYWLYDYCKVWHMRNKESELFRIKETFNKICDSLRCYD